MNQVLKSTVSIGMPSFSRADVERRQSYGRFAAAFASIVV